MTRVYYDTEFLESSLSLISIGMVADSGEELYLENIEAPWNDIIAHDWMRLNVVPHLSWKDAVTEYELTRYVMEFLAQFTSIELWAWYGAYDHVLLTKLLGGFDSKLIPHYTHDLRQEYDFLGVDPDSHVPDISFRGIRQTREHHALYDAKVVEWRHGKLKEVMNFAGSAGTET